MRSIVAIRTHRWGEEEERLLAALGTVEGHDLAVVFHDRPAGLSLPLDVVEIDDAWLGANGLRAVPDWGWRCGDYFYYALRAARPDFSHYWLIEPDVHFAGSADAFFARFRQLADDALGYRIAPFREKIAFARGLTGIEIFRAIFALTRLSGRAIDRLFDLRKAYCTDDRAARFFVNDELFVFSHAVAAPDLGVGDLEAIAPEWFEGTQFDTNPDILVDLLADRRKGVFHPVHGRASFKRAVAARLSPGSAFLRNVRAGLRQLDASELDEIADLSAARLRVELGRWHRTRR